MTNPGVKRSRERKTPETRRVEILMAVRAEAIKSGIESVTVRDVAQEAGIAPGLIHYYFGSVDELLAEAFSLWADEALEAMRLAADDPPPLRIAKLEQNIRRDYRFWHEALGAASRHKALRRLARKVTAEYVAWVERAIEEGVRAGSFVCPNPHAAAWRIVLLIDGLIAMVFVLRSLSVDEALDFFRGALECELRLGEAP